MNVEFQIHGVLSGGQSYWKPQDVDYYQTLYASRPEDVLMTVETLRRPHGICTYYNYLRSNNVVSKREGSYFGMTVRIDDGYCMDVRGMFDILDNLFEKMIVGTILTPVDGEKIKYAIEESFTQVTSYLEKVESSFFNMYNAFFGPSDIKQAPVRSTSSRYNVNPIDLSKDLVIKAMREGIKIGVSPAYTPAVAKSFERKAAEAVERANARMAEIEQNNLTQLQREHAESQRKIEELRKTCEAANSQTTGQRQLAVELQEKNLLIQQLQQENEELKALANNVPDRPALNDDRPPLNGTKPGPQDSRPETGPSAGKKPGKPRKPFNPDRRYHTVLILLWTIIFLLILSMCKSCGNGTPEEATIQTEEANDQENPYADLEIQVLGIGKDDPLLKGKNYQVQLSQTPPSAGDWFYKIDNERLPLVLDRDKGSFLLPISEDCVSDSVEIQYVVDGEIKVRRTKQIQ